MLKVLWSSEASGQLWNTCVWDLHSGTVEHTFKGGIPASNCLCLVGKDYLLSAESGKPLLHHWPVCKKVCSARLLLLINVLVIYQKKVFTINCKMQKSFT